MLGAFLGALLVAVGVAELIAQHDNPTALLVFWLPALWGGAACILYGTLHARGRRLSLTLIWIGCAAASLATMWTIVVPLLLLTLAALAVARPAATA